MKNININIKYIAMDKDHLLRLQAKVKKLMHAESEDSDSDD